MPPRSNPTKKPKKKSVQTEKKKFRATKEWQKFRKYMKSYDHNRDYITGKPLRAGYNLHHLNLDENAYCDISDPEHFISLNKKTHDCLHYFWTYYHSDKRVLDRLEEILEKMEELNRSA